MRETKKIKRTLFFSVLSVVIAVAVTIGTTFAWYIYTVSSNTTKLRLAAGTSITLQISNQVDGTYSSSAQMETFEGKLVPVSTNCIQNGFQKVEHIDWTDTERPLADRFKAAVLSDKEYYKTSLFFRTNSKGLNVYLANVGYADDDEQNPISTAIRIGIVIPSTGEEYIFSINEAKNPEAQYNTKTGQEGYVLDSTKTDGTTVPFNHYTEENWCNYDSSTGASSLKENSIPLFYLTGTGRDFGEPVEVEVYIWLEGCDEDCTDNLGWKTLEELSVSFAGIE